MTPLLMSGRLSGRVEMAAAAHAATAGYFRQSANDSVDAIQHHFRRAGYVTSGRVEELRRSLSARDLAVLRTLERVHVATGGQLLRLNCLDYAEPRERQCRRALEALSDKGLLTRLGRSIGGARGGSAGWVYALNIAGQRLVESTAARRPRRPWTPGLPFLFHALAVTEVYVRLVEAAREGTIGVEDFATEPKCWRRFPGPAADLVCKPDARAITHVGVFEDHWFVEVDLATESSSTIERKLDVYRALWQSGVEQEGLGLFPRVLWLVPDERRKELIVTACGRQPAEAWQLFQVATFGRLLEVVGAKG